MTATPYEIKLYRDAVLRTQASLVEARSIVRSVVEAIEDRSDLELLLPRLRDFLHKDLATPRGGSSLGDEPQ